MALVRRRLLLEILTAMAIAISLLPVPPAAQKTTEILRSCLAIRTARFSPRSTTTPLAVADEADNAITVFPEKSTKPYLKKTITFPTCSSPTIVIPAQLRPQRPEDLVVVCSEGVGVMLNTQK